MMVIGEGDPVRHPCFSTWPYRKLSSTRGVALFFVVSDPIPGGGVVRATLCLLRDGVRPPLTLAPRVVCCHASQCVPREGPVLLVLLRLRAVNYLLGNVSQWCVAITPLPDRASPPPGPRIADGE
jgi:hypothetical protein